jgi:hypothetical protein
MTREIVLIPEILFTGQLPFLPPGMLEDLMAVGRVPADRLDALAVELVHHTGIPNAQQLEEMVARHIADQALVKPVLNTLINVRSDRVDETIRTVQRWRDARPQNATILPGETLDTIRDRLSRLVRDHPALVRYRKAQRLKTRTGRMADAIDITCDLRPVFDQSRTVVEGLIPITTLRVVYSNNDRSESFEVLLSADDLNTLSEEVEKAKQKLQSLNQHAEHWVPHGWVEPD